VYRALDFLLDAGFVHKVESINAFVACPHPGGVHAAQFLVCDQCGAAIEIDSASLPTQLEQIAKAQAFTAKRMVVEVHGLCAACAP
jgi:Fur family transcriptional regulator, zinc uptake regulator